MKAKEELTIIEIVNKSTDFLSSKGIDGAKSEVEWILSSVLETTRVQLYLDHENLVSEEKVNSIRDMVMKRGKRIPLQHILGNSQLSDSAVCGVDLNQDGIVNVTGNLFKKLVPEN